MLGMNLQDRLDSKVDPGHLLKVQWEKGIHQRLRTVRPLERLHEAAMDHVLGGPVIQLQIVEEKFHEIYPDKASSSRQVTSIMMTEQPHPAPRFLICNSVRMAAPSAPGRRPRSTARSSRSVDQFLHDRLCRLHRHDRVHAFTGPQGHCVDRANRRSIRHEWRQS